MERIPKGIYTPEFRVEAVKLVEEGRLSVDAAAKRLSVPKSSLANWVRASRAGKLAKVGQGQRVPTETEVELAGQTGVDLTCNSHGTSSARLCRGIDQHIPSGTRGCTVLLVSFGCMVALRILLSVTSRSGSAPRKAE